MTTTFGFGHNDAGIGNRAKKFKGEKGKTYRLGLPWFPGIEKDGFNAASLLVPEGEPETSLTPNFIRAPRNYIQGVGYVINQGPEWTQLAGESPKMMIATIVVSWTLGKNGQPSQASLLEDLPDVMPWIFAGDKYEKLKKQHISGYPMHDWDIQLDCEDTQFQKFSFLPAKQCIFKEMLKAGDKAKHITDHIIERTRSLSANLEREIGQKLTLDQLREKMGHDVSMPVGNVVSGDAEVDNLLGSMLND